MSLIQLSRLIDLPDSDLQQVLDYALTLSKAEAADHFKNLLGDSPQAIEFIAAFNSRRQDPAGTSSSSSSSSSQPSNQQQAQDQDGVPKFHRQAKKKKAPLHTPAPRQVASLGPTPGTAYNKKALDDDYIIGRSGATTPVNSRPPSKAPTPKSSTPPPSKPPPSAAGNLVSDLLAAPKSKPRSNPVSRTSTPGPGSRGTGSSAKVSIAGGTPMHGASTALSDLDAAIRSLEITTNPSLSGADDVAARRCNCVATRHPLQTAAPNCLSCGKVVCVKEGLGPCTFCGTPLLSQTEVQAMIKELRVERGRERMAVDREAHKRPDVAASPRPFTKPRGEAGGELSAAEVKAREHRDKLLGFQAQNARRTTVRDEAADFDVSGAMAGAFGGNIWSTPEDRARELKRQQKILREMEWNARPDYEKRKQVVSIDLVGGRVVKKMMAVERPPSPDEPDGRAEPSALEEVNPNRGGGGGGGTFSRNPLLGGMIKPVYEGKGKGAELEGRKDRKTRWRRVQDDLDDNEAVILDGGIYGGKNDAGITAGGDEPPCG